jgi:hypothetical protein
MSFNTHCNACDKPIIPLEALASAVATRCTCSSKELPLIHMQKMPFPLSENQSLEFIKQIQEGKFFTLKELVDRHPLAGSDSILTTELICKPLSKDGTSIAYLLLITPKPEGIELFKDFIRLKLITSEALNTLYQAPSLPWRMVNLFTLLVQKAGLLTHDLIKKNLIGREHFQTTPERKLYLSEVLFTFIQTENFELIYYCVEKNWITIQDLNKEIYAGTVGAGGLKQNVSLAFPTLALLALYSKTDFIQWWHKNQKITKQDLEVPWIDNFQIGEKIYNGQIKHLLFTNPKLKDIVKNCIESEELATWETKEKPFLDLLGTLQKILSVNKSLIIHFNPTTLKDDLEFTQTLKDDLECTQSMTFKKNPARPQTIQERLLAKLQQKLEKSQQPIGPPSVQKKTASPKQPSAPIASPLEAKEQARIKAELETKAQLDAAAKRKAEAHAKSVAQLEEQKKIKAALEAQAQLKADMNATDQRKDKKKLDEIKKEQKAQAQKRADQEAERQAYYATFGEFIAYKQKIENDLLKKNYAAELEEAKKAKNTRFIDAGKFYNQQLLISKFRNWKQYTADSKAASLQAQELARLAAERQWAWDREQESIEAQERWIKNQSLPQQIKAAWPKPLQITTQHFMGNIIFQQRPMLSGDPNCSAYDVIPAHQLPPTIACNLLFLKKLIATNKGELSILGSSCKKHLLESLLPWGTINVDAIKPGDLDLVIDQSKLTPVEKWTKENNSVLLQQEFTLVIMNEFYLQYKKPGIDLTIILSPTYSSLDPIYLTRIRLFVGLKRDVLVFTWGMAREYEKVVSFKEVIDQILTMPPSLKLDSLIVPNELGGTFLPGEGRRCARDIDKRFLKYESIFKAVFSRYQLGDFEQRLKSILESQNTRACPPIPSSRF